MLRQRRMLATVVALGLLTGCSAVAIGHFGVQGLGELAGRIAAARVTALGHAILHVPMRPIPEAEDAAPPNEAPSAPSPAVGDEPERPEPEPAAGQAVSQPVPIAEQPDDRDPPPSRSEPPERLLPETPVVLDGWLGRSGERAEAPSAAAPASTSAAAPAATSAAAPGVSGAAPTGAVDEVLELLTR